MRVMHMVYDQLSARMDSRAQEREAKSNQPQESRQTISTTMARKCQKSTSTSRHASSAISQTSESTRQCILHMDQYVSLSCRVVLAQIWHLMFFHYKGK
jgi:hypothetical protein